VTHPARAELGADFVTANRFACGERQRHQSGGIAGSTEASGIVDQAVKETKGDSHKEAQEAQKLP